MTRARPVALTRGRSCVVVDQYTDDVVQAIDARTEGAGTRIMYALYPAKVGGLGMLALAAFASCALTWLATGGVWTCVRWGS